jgi:HAD superfamily hydrolase (TIGR01509 family)
MRKRRIMDKTIKAVLFDMDGVLANSEIYTAKAAAITFNRIGIPAKEDDFALFRGMGADDYLRGVAEMYGHTYNKGIKTDLYSVYADIVSKTDISIKDAAAVVKALKDRGYKTAVCSSADREKLEINVRAIGLDVSAFDVILSGSDVKRQKPAPDVYLLGAEKVGCLPEECIVIEDALSGIESAHAAGMECIAVTTSFDKETLKKEGKPEYIISELTEILDIVK